MDECEPLIGGGISAGGGGGISNGTMVGGWQILLATSRMSFESRNAGCGFKCESMTWQVVHARPYTMDGSEPGGGPLADALGALLVRAMDPLCALSTSGGGGGGESPMLIDGSSGGEGGGGGGGEGGGGGGGGSGAGGGGGDSTVGDRAAVVDEWRPLAEGAASSLRWLAHECGTGQNTPGPGGTGTAEPLTESAMEALCETLRLAAAATDGGAEAGVSVTLVGQCRLTVSKPLFKAPMVSALETII